MKIDSMKISDNDVLSISFKMNIYTDDSFNKLTKDIKKYIKHMINIMVYTLSSFHGMYGYIFCKSYSGGDIRYIYHMVLNGLIHNIDENKHKIFNVDLNDKSVIVSGNGLVKDCEVERIKDLKMKLYITNNDNKIAVNLDVTNLYWKNILYVINEMVRRKDVSPGCFITIYNNNSKTEIYEHTLISDLIMGNRD